MYILYNIFCFFGDKKYVELKYIAEKTDYRICRYNNW